MSQILIWLMAHAVAALAGGALVVHLALRWPPHRAVLASSGVLACLYLLIGADSLRAPVNPEDGGWVLLGNTVLLALAFAAVAAQVFGGLGLIRDRLGGWKQAGLAALLVCQVGVIGWTGWRYREVVVATAGKRVNGNAAMEEVAGAALLTDKQRLVPLFQIHIVGNWERYAEFTKIEYDHCIVRSDADLTTNCHGWVFTGGQYHVKDEGVQMLLDDNGYRVVADPRQGDLIVYRDAANQIVHSGLVRLALEDGEVLVESKWGLGRRYLHFAEVQNYSQNFAYYRSDRAAPLPDGTQHLVRAVAPGTLPRQLEEAIVGPSPPARPRVVDSFGNPMPPGESLPVRAE